MPKAPMTDRCRLPTRVAVSTQYNLCRKVLMQGKFCGKAESIGVSGRSFCAVIGIGREFVTVEFGFRFRNSDRQTPRQSHGSGNPVGCTQSFRCSRSSE